MFAPRRPFAAWLYVDFVHCFFGRIFLASIVLSQFFYTTMCRGTCDVTAFFERFDETAFSRFPMFFDEQRQDLARLEIIATELFSIFPSSIRRKDSITIPKIDETIWIPWERFAEVYLLIEAISIATVITSRLFFPVFHGIRKARGYFILER